MRTPRIRPVNTELLYKSLSQNRDRPEPALLSVLGFAIAKGKETTGFFSACGGRRKSSRRVGGGVSVISQETVGSGAIRDVVRR